MKVLGLCGHAGSGKDYTCEALAHYLSKQTVVRVAFADELRLEVQEELGGGLYLPNLWEKPYPEPVRWVLQHYGTEYRRAQDQDYWVKKVRNTLYHANYMLGADLAIITDLRFANEADLVHEFGGMVAQVVSNRSAERAGSVPAHASEEIDFYPDAVILNNDRLRFPPKVLEYLGLEEENHPWQ